ncbi:TPR repeat-containing protein [Candidatus Gastranaerophilus sp. (ex Termes propinquus)]|nr:TPR repeat-containing protein [Candidatus Gastranaerophilus sp. (ex Termes propinquus)]
MYKGQEREQGFEQEFEQGLEQAKEGEADTQGATRPLELAVKAHQRYLLKATNEDLNEAINFYIMAIKSDPNIPETYYRLASLLHQNGQIGIHAAIEQCREALRLDPANANAHLHLGYFLAMAEEIDEAKTHFKAAIRLKPFGSARTRIVLALTLLENRKGSGCKDLKNFAQALYCLVSGSLLFLGDKTGMKVFCKNIVNDLNVIKCKLKGSIFEKFNKDKEAYNIYLEALDSSKDSAELYCRMAKIAVKNSRFEVALECYQSAVVVSKNSPEALVNAIEFVSQHFPDNVDELLDYYTILAGHNPTFSRCYYDMGHLYLKKDDKINALNAFNMALDNDRNNPYYKNSLAFAYVQLEQYDLAIDLYKEALEANPDNEWSALIAQALASIYHQIKGNTQAALSALQHGLLLTRDKSQIHLATADIYYDLNELDEAIKYYTMALKGDMQNAKAHSRLAMAYWEKDEIEKAVAHYTLSLEIDPEYDIAYNNLGVVYLDGLNDYDRALKCFEKAAATNPDYVLAHFNCARAHEALGEKIEAANKYQLAADLNETKPEIAKEVIEERLFGLFNT